jgi:hypothetical protein
MMVSGNLDTDVRIRVNDTLVKEADKCIYLGSDINLEGEIDREINIKIQNR